MTNELSDAWFGDASASWTGDEAGPRFRFETEAVELDLRYTDLYPLTDFMPRGSAALTEEFAPHHYESSSRVVGTARVGDATYDIDGFGHRDHSWGVRRWDDALAVHRWVCGVIEPDLAFGSITWLAPGSPLVGGGYVVRDGEVRIADATDVVVWLEADGVTHRGGELALTFGEERLVFTCHATDGWVNRHHDVVWIDELCTVEHNGRTGYADFEVSHNPRMGTAPLSVFLRSGRRQRAGAPLTVRTAVVVGGGAAGISAAFWLQRAGVDVRVLEASDSVGGRCRSVTHDGYRFDTGTGALPDTYDAVLRMVAALGIGHEVERRGAVIGTLADGRVHRIDRRRPQSFLAARHLSAGDKAQLWKFGVDLARMYRSINDDDLSTAARFDVETVARMERSPAAAGRAARAVRGPAVPCPVSRRARADVGRRPLRRGQGAARRRPSRDSPRRRRRFPRSRRGPSRRGAGRVERGGSSITAAAARVTWEDSGGEHVDDVDVCVVALPAPRCRT